MSLFSKKAKLEGGFWVNGSLRGERQRRYVTFPIAIWYRALPWHNANVHSSRAICTFFRTYLVDRETLAATSHSNGLSAETNTRFIRYTPTKTELGTFVNGKGHLPW